MQNTCRSRIIALARLLFDRTAPIRSNSVWILSVHARTALPGRRPATPAARLSAAAPTGPGSSGSACGLRSGGRWPGGPGCSGRTRVFRNGGGGWWRRSLRTARALPRRARVMHDGGVGLLSPTGGGDGTGRRTAPRPPRARRGGGPRRSGGPGGGSARRTPALRPRPSRRPSRRAVPERPERPERPSPPTPCEPSGPAVPPGLLVPSDPADPADPAAPPGPAPPGGPTPRAAAARPDPTASPNARPRRGGAASRARPGSHRMCTGAPAHAAAPRRPPCPPERVRPGPPDPGAPSPRTARTGRRSPGSSRGTSGPAPRGHGGGSAPRGSADGAPRTYGDGTPRRRGGDFAGSCHGMSCPRLEVRGLTGPTTSFTPRAATGCGRAITGSPRPVRDPVDNGGADRSRPPTAGSDRSDGNRRNAGTRERGNA